MLVQKSNFNLLKFHFMIFIFENLFLEYLENFVKFNPDKNRYIVKVEKSCEFKSQIKFNFLIEILTFILIFFALLKTTIHI